MNRGGFDKVLVANRGAAAARVIRALNELGIASVAIYSEADSGAPYLAAASEAHCVGPPPARESYLDQARILAVAAATGAGAIHPGYGFLSENAAFARGVEAAGLVFIGPSPRWIEAMGEKTEARALMGRHGLPVAAGSGLLDPSTDVEAAARAIGFPVLVKPAAGGGGIGMIVARDEAGLGKAVARARSMATRSFGNGHLYLERYLDRPRHIEFQVLGDRHGAVRHLFERDCSLQRRHQKVVEEAPAPGLTRTELDGMAETVTRVLAAIGYDNIGTVEMLRAEEGGFAFLEMNTRLQVEHAVTEMVTGLDLVKGQIRSAAGEVLADILPAEIRLDGHAVEARIYAEDPDTFMPSPGPLRRFRLCEPVQGIRVETGYAEGGEVTPFYDPMLAKVIAHAPTRAEALDRLADALAAIEIEGVRTNISFCLKALRHAGFRQGAVHTGLAGEIAA
ncbi:acetyl/propionyl/methylcrotonyl-CoA carboxylase subunit alpha [uncultured Enterovirga sp.]|uniref:acetyl-CoA carboxylase biotin carboxylase subunit n=1 Tax=uncultured Enterovirga sp. TaxID=2026352 RepID=UPI0035CC446C